MITDAAILQAVGATGLAIVGAFHPKPEDDLDNVGTVLLLGPGNSQMWSSFARSAEFRDGSDNPLDRWSRRIIDKLASELGATAAYPFGGPPWPPFQRWAEYGEKARPSPVGMLVAAGRGLWASYRGALHFPQMLELQAEGADDPCAPCGKPCLTACPIGAFASGMYDVPACTAHLKTASGAECLNGCLVRRSCPAGAALELPQEQRRFHMHAFLKANG